MKVSYRQRFCKDGTHYNQGISMTQGELDKLKLAIQSEQTLNFPREKEYNSCGHARLFLTDLKREGDVVFMNITQCKFINLFCKLRLLPRNTYIIVC